MIDEGFGIAYMINERELRFNVVSKKIGSARLASLLQQAVEEIRDMMEEGGEAGEVKAKL